MGLDILNTMIRNTKQHNLRDDKLTRSANDMYLATVTPLVQIPVYHPPPPLRGVS